MSAPPATLAAGTWGGEQVTLSVGASKAVLRLGCAEGELAAPIVIDSEGRFSSRGIFTAHGGGPSAPHERGQQAQYEGQIADGRLTLTVRHGAASDTYRLTHGQQSKVIRCL